MMNAIVSRRQWLQAGLAFAAAIAFGAGLRLDAPATGALVLSAEEIDVVRALAAVMFPGDPFPVDGLQAGVAEEVDRIVGDLLVEPAASGFRYVLRAVEWGTLASRGARFSQLPADDRRDVLDAWADPTVLPRRVAWDSIRLVLGMAYFRHPQVLDRIGWRSSCAAGTA
jgi:hypothetical protein